MDRITTGSTFVLLVTATPFQKISKFLDILCLCRLSVNDPQKVGICAALSSMEKMFNILSEENDSIFILIFCQKYFVRRER